MPVVRPSAEALRRLHRRDRQRARAGVVRGTGRVAGPSGDARRAFRFVPDGVVRRLQFAEGPDSERNRAWLGRTSHHGCPTLELMTLVETGTRAPVGAVFGPTAEGEATSSRSRTATPSSSTHAVAEHRSALRSTSRSSGTGQTLFSVWYQWAQAGAGRSSGCGSKPSARDTKAVSGSANSRGQSASSGASRHGRRVSELATFLPSGNGPVNGCGHGKPACHIGRCTQVQATSRASSSRTFSTTSRPSAGRRP